MIPENSFYFSIITLISNGFNRKSQIIEQMRSLPTNTQVTKNKVSEAINCLIHNGIIIKITSSVILYQVNPSLEEELKKMKKSFIKIMRKSKKNLIIEELNKLDKMKNEM